MRAMLSPLLSCLPLKRGVTSLWLVTLTAAAAATLSGCASPAKEHFYQLSFAAPISTAEVAAHAAYDVQIEYVRIPEAINRPQLVVQQTATEALVRDDQRWIAPIDEQMRQALQANLQAQLPHAWVSEHPQGNMSTTRYRISIDVRDLRTTLASEVSMDVVWVIADANKHPLRRQQRRISVPLKDSDYRSIAPAISAGLQNASLMMADDVRLLAETPQHQ